MSDKTPQVLDIEEQEAIAAALQLMVQQCPFLTIGKTITHTHFEDLSTNAVGIYAEPGTVYKRRFLDGSFIGQYSCSLRYRVDPKSDARKISEQGKLDALAQWLEGRSVTVNGNTYQRTGFPELTDNRVIRRIERRANASAEGQFDDGSIVYIVPLQLEYTKE